MEEGWAADNIKMWTSRPPLPPTHSVARVERRGIRALLLPKVDLRLPSPALPSLPSTVSARTLNLSRGSVRSSEWVDRGRHHRFLNARNGMEAPRTADGTADADADEDHADGIDVLEVTDDARTFRFVNL